jgi:hypothetical protein
VEPQATARSASTILLVKPIIDSVIAGSAIAEKP